MRNEYLKNKIDLFLFFSLQLFDMNLSTKINSKLTKIVYVSLCIPSSICVSFISFSFFFLFNFKELFSPWYMWSSNYLCFSQSISSLSFELKYWNESHWTMNLFILLLYIQNKRVACELKLLQLSVVRVVELQSELDLENHFNLTLVSWI